MDQNTERPKILKIFVGEDDFAEQNELAAKRRRQGWMMIRDSNDFQVTAANASEIKDAIGVINGATAYDCVPKLADKLLGAKVSQLVVPLPLIKAGAEQNGPLVARAARFAYRLRTFSRLEDERVIVTPTDLWQDTKDRVSAFRGSMGWEDLLQIEHEVLQAFPQYRSKKP